MVARHGARHGVLERVARQLAASAPQPPVVPDQYRHATPAAVLASLPAYTLEEVRAAHCVITLLIQCVGMVIQSTRAGWNMTRVACEAVRLRNDAGFAPG